MLYQKDNNFNESASPHSIGLANALTIPSPGWDSNYRLGLEKQAVGAANTIGKGTRGFPQWGVGLSGMGCDGGLGCAGGDNLIVLAVVVIGAMALAR